MLVNCPRCGFSQPQDKYCAQCGVDMETFKPPRKPLFARLFKDPLIYLATALVVTGVLIFNLYKQDKSDIAQRVKFLKGSLQIASTNGQDKRDTHPPDAPQISEPPRQKNVEPAALTASTEPTEVKPSAPVAPTPPSATVNDKAMSATDPVVSVYYAEVPQYALERLYQESQATGQFNSFGDYTAGILPDIHSRIQASGLKIRVLEKSEKAISKVQQWFTGIRDPESDEEMGLSTFIEITDSENQVIRGNLEIVRSLREVDLEKSRGLGATDTSAAAAGVLQKSSFPAQFELGPGYGFFVAGVLPRKTQIAHLEQLTEKAPSFSLLKSAAFQNKQTEFVIFIEFEKKP